MVVKITVNVEIDTDEEKSVIVDRLRSCDYSSLMDYDLDYALDELGEVESIELDTVEAL